MSKRLLICVLLLLTFGAMIATACINDGGSAGGITSASVNSTPVPQGIQITRSANATATFAADQFNQQLTAIAEEKKQP